ncbi:uncharacterized protein PV07_08653 [Cladophialophora immunda]|uniref:Uncharacterized protein n=1 Tax=Cladophialophora immunda TaxID=569365 RepID=A0A0D2AKK3_9EURO|nr:uncharacterized protein PV07_08653 [Cladophialophora immunda]KIW25487.1 hypothetical protein PV07_08653 [Cladophialophora immunda]
MAEPEPDTSKPLSKPIQDPFKPDVLPPSRFHGPINVEEMFIIGQHIADSKPFVPSLRELHFPTARCYSTHPSAESGQLELVALAPSSAQPTHSGLPCSTGEPDSSAAKEKDIKWEANGHVLSGPAWFLILYR